MASQFAFAAFASVVVLSAWRAVTTPDVTRSALALLIALGGMAPLFVMLAAEFAAAVQVLVYVGAVVVLVLFGIMLTHSPVGAEEERRPRSLRWPAAALVIGLFLVLWVAVRDAFGDEKVTPRVVGRTADVGSVLLRDHLVAFEVVSVLLLATLVGAIALARRD